MGVEQVHFSDLTGVRVPDPAQLAHLTVEHPDFEEPRLLEALPDEVKDLGKLAIQPVTVELALPAVEGQEPQEPQRFQLTAQAFGKLAVGRSIADVLAEAPTVQPEPRKRAGGNGGETGINYGSIEHAGTPHKGRTTDREARMVRDNLEAINARLAAAGQRTIDPANAEHAKRYGFA